MGVTALIAGVVCVYLAIRAQEGLMTRERRTRRGLEPVPGFGRAFVRGYFTGLAIYSLDGASLLLIALGIAQLAYA